jgi:hypothetical protein
MDILSKIKTCIHIGDLDHYTVKYIIDDCDIDKGAFSSTGLTLNQYKPSANDKIYFILGCSIPRFKVKQFCEKHNNAVVKYKEKANVIFTSPDILDKLVQGVGEMYYKEPILNWFKKRKNNNQDVKDLILNIENSEANYIILEYNALRNLKDKHGIKLKDFLDKDENESIAVEYEQTPNIMFNSAEDLAVYKDLCANPNLYHQNELLYRLSDNVITEGEYFRIKDLLISTDKENTKLVMEIMANCDYKKSAVYLLLLLKDYGQRFWDSETRDHVNFASLLQFFDVRDRLCRLDLDDILRVLLNHKLLNRLNHDIIMPLILHKINAGEVSNYAAASIVKVSDRIIQGLAENVLDNEPDTEIVEDTEELEPKLK